MSCWTFADLTRTLQTFCTGRKRTYVLRALFNQVNKLLCGKLRWVSHSLIPHGRWPKTAGLPEDCQPEPMAWGLQIILRGFCVLVKLLLNLPVVVESKTLDWQHVRSRLQICAGRFRSSNLPSSPSLLNLTTVVNSPHDNHLRPEKHKGFWHNAKSTSGPTVNSSPKYATHINFWLLFSQVWLVLWWPSLVGLVNPLHKFRRIYGGHKTQRLFL